MLGIGSNFGVTNNGDLYCTSGNFSGNVKFSGELNGPSGKIGGWYIGDDYLSSEEIDSYVSVNYLSINGRSLSSASGLRGATGSIVFLLQDRFAVDENGHMVA